MVALMVVMVMAVVVVKGVMFEGVELGKLGLLVEKEMVEAEVEQDTERTEVEDLEGVEEVEVEVANEQKINSILSFYHNLNSTLTISVYKQSNFCN